MVDYKLSVQELPYVHSKLPDMTDANFLNFQTDMCWIDTYLLSAGQFNLIVNLQNYCGFRIKVKAACLLNYVINKEIFSYSFISEPLELRNEVVWN